MRSVGISMTLALTLGMPVSAYALEDAPIPPAPVVTGTPEAAPAPPPAERPKPQEKPKLEIPKIAERPRPGNADSTASPGPAAKLETVAPVSVVPPPSTTIPPGPVKAHTGDSFSCLALAFAMLILGVAAGFLGRHLMSRHKLGGMTVRIGTWRGIP